MERNSFVFYKSFYESINELSDAEQIAVFQAMMQYQFEGTEPTLSGVPKAVFVLIKPQLDANNSRYENGCKGGRPKTETKPNNNQNKTKQQPNENENENVNENENDKKEKILKEKVSFDDEFEELWKLYPNKKGKVQAKQKYSLARKQGATYEEVRQGLGHYIKFCEEQKIDSRYIKHGSTWFNQKCWLDEYGETKQILPSWMEKEPEIAGSGLSEEQRRFIEKVRGSNI